jgi:hypothetical protein
MQLSELTTQFVALANRRDLSASTTLQTTFINQGIMRIQRELRCPAMEKSVLVTIASNYAGLVIPNDFLELQKIIPQSGDDSQESLIKQDINKAFKLSQIIDVPEIYARQGGVWVLGPSPAVGSVIRLDYYAEISPLVLPTDTNIISIMAWDLMVYAALVQMAIFYKDSRKDDFEDQYQTVLGGLQTQSDEDDQNGSAVVQPCYSFPADYEFDHY